MQEIENISILDFFSQTRTLLLSTIEELLHDLNTHTMAFSPLWTQHISDMLQQYTQSGKCVRGSLFLYWIHAYGGGFQASSYIKIAAALEILQTFLLIHDDIMDDDDMRRGQKSIHITSMDILSQGYEETQANDQSFLKKGGESLAICIGDVLHAYTHQIFADNAPPEILGRLISNYAYYVQRVGAGQIQDVYWSYASQKVRNALSSEEILKMYELKTSEYTFTLPSLLGMICAQTMDSTQYHQEREILQKIGNAMGIVFQIQDDIIGARQESNITGKPKGSDFIQRKHTYLLSLLLQEAERRHSTKSIEDLLAMPSIGEKEVAQILSYADNWGIWDIAGNYQEDKCQESVQLIEQLHISSSHKEALIDFLSYMKTRTH